MSKITTMPTLIFGNGAEDCETTCAAGDGFSNPLIEMSTNNGGSINNDARVHSAHSGADILTDLFLFIMILACVDKVHKEVRLAEFHN